jgi:hypothetical protein
LVEAGGAAGESASIRPWQPEAVELLSTPLGSYGCQHQESPGDELIGQLRQLTGRGATEIVREALEENLRRQRRLLRIERLRQQLPALQQQAGAQARPFAAESLYDSHGLPG